MPRNLELKIRVDSHLPFERILKENGAEFIGEFEQKDVYYLYDKGLLKLRLQAGGPGQLIKYIRDEKNIDRWSDYEIMYLDGDNPVNYLNDILDFETEVIKRRKAYFLRNTRVHLDIVSKLGNFLELETLVITDDPAARNDFSRMKEILGLTERETINCSYRDLIINK